MITVEYLYNTMWHFNETKRTFEKRGIMLKFENDQWSALKNKETYFVDTIDDLENLLK